MRKFTVTIEIYDTKFQVVGSHSHRIPAKTNCSNDDATPAEGGLEAIDSVYLLDKKGEKVELPDFLQEVIDRKFIDNGYHDHLVEAALTEAMTSEKEVD